jgi:hypothetical protein
LLDDHVTVRPVSTVLFKSLSVAVSCCVGVRPRTKVGEAGLTTTVATGTGSTVITGVAVLGADSLLAVIIAVPSPVAVTITVAPVEPLTVLAALTVNTAVLLETQFTVRPTSGFPLPSFGVAVSCWVSPKTTGVVKAERVRAATGMGVTVIEAVPFFPSLVAVIVAVPTDTAVTTPVWLTVATTALFELHVTARPVRTLP